MEHREHLIFEALGLVVLCLIFFATIVELIRKLRIFVLEETKLEARLLSVQFCIFLLAYGSKVITLVYWIRNPPQQRDDIDRFLINTDIMQLLWIVIPISFIFWMQTRSFYKMRVEKRNEKLMLDIESEIKQDDESEDGEYNKAIEETISMT